VTLESLSLETLVYNFHGEGACHGDSGGPAFSEIGGVWHQIGVTSWGDPSCSSTGHYQRLDVLALGSRRKACPRRARSIAKRRAATTSAKRIKTAGA
jgi:hypothetical protein